MNLYRICLSLGLMVSWPLFFPSQVLAMPIIESSIESEFKDSCEKFGGVSEQNLNETTCKCHLTGELIYSKNRLDIIQAKSCSHLTLLSNNFPHLDVQQLKLYLMNLANFFQKLSYEVVIYYDKRPFDNKENSPVVIKKLAEEHGLDEDHVSIAWQQATKINLLKSLLFELNKFKIYNTRQINELIDQYGKILGNNIVRKVVGNYFKQQIETNLVKASYLNQYAIFSKDPENIQLMSALLKRAQQQIEYFKKTEWIEYDDTALYEQIRKASAKARKDHGHDQSENTRPRWADQMKGSLNKTAESLANITIGNVLYYSGGLTGILKEFFTGPDEFSKRFSRGFQRGSALGTNFMLEQQRLNNLTYGSVLGTTEELAKKSKLEGFLAMNSVTHVGASVGNAMEGLYEGYISYASNTLGVSREEYEAMKEKDPWLKTGEISFLIFESSAGLALATLSANPMAFAARITKAQQIATAGNNLSRLNKISAIQKAHRISQLQGAGKVLAVAGGLSAGTSIAFEVYHSDKEQEDFSLKNVIDNTLKSTAASVLFMGSLAQIGNISAKSVAAASKGVPSVSKIGLGVDMVEGSGDFEENIRLIRESTSSKQKWASSVLALLSGYDFGGDYITSGLYHRQASQTKLDAKFKKVEREFSQEEVLANSRLSKELRFAKALEITNLTDPTPESKQRLSQALERAHLHGKGTLYAYTWIELRAKYRMLTEAGFSKDQADLILRAGLAGKESATFTLSNTQIKELEQFQNRKYQNLTLEENRKLEQAKESFKKNLLPKLTKLTWDAGVWKGKTAYPFKGAYQGIADVLNDPVLVFDRVQELEAKVLVKLKTEKNKSNETILNELLLEEEKNAGFGTPIELERRGYSTEEWFKMLHQGRPFMDTAFKGGIKEVGNRKGHGYLTHRIQLHVVLREYQENPQKFKLEDGRPLPKFVTLFKLMGSMRYREKIEVANGPWMALFDSFNSSFHSPETFHQIHDYVENIAWE